MGPSQYAPVAAVIVAGLLLLGKFVVIPIVHIVFGHQRQLAGVETPAATIDAQKIERLESEVQELKNRLNEQAILLDHRRSSATRTEEIESRLAN